MDFETDDKPEQAIAPKSKQPWRAPQIIRQTLSNAEQGGHLSADFSVAS